MVKEKGEYQDTEHIYDDIEFDEELDGPEYDSEEGTYEDNEYEDEGEDYYEDSLIEEENYYSDGIKGTIEYAIDYLMSIDIRIKRILSVCILIVVVITISKPVLKMFKGKDKIPVMTEMSMENLPLDENGNIINPTYDEEGNLIGIPVHPDIQSLYGELYFPDGQDVEKVDEMEVLDEWADNQVNPEGGDNDIMTDPGEEEEPDLKDIPEDITVKIENLPPEFYSKNPDSSKIQETNYRNLGVVPEHESENDFLVYNWKGDLDPLNRDGDYINREIIGRVFNYKMFTSANTYQIQEVETRNMLVDIPVLMSNGFNRTLANAIIKSEIGKMKQEKIYRDLEFRTDDYITNYVINLMDQSNHDTSSASEYFIPDAKFTTEEGGFQQFQYDLVSQVVKDIRIIPSRQLSNEQLGKIHYKLYNYLINDKVNEYKKVACDELNGYKKGMCSNPKDISTLEIKSDFMQDAYVNAYKESIEHYYYVMFRVYDELNPASDI